MSNPQQSIPAQPTTATAVTTPTATVPAAPAAVATTITPAPQIQFQQDERTSLSTRIAYFAVGSAIGAVVALLFAPKAGRELRTDLADATRKGVDRTRDAAHTLGTKAGEYYEVSRERAAELYASASHKAGEVASAAREGAHRRGEQLSAAIEAGKQAYAEEKRRADALDSNEAAPTYYEVAKDQTRTEPT